jgi:hypothetical protein
MYTLQGKIRPTRHTFFTLSPRMVYDHMYLTRSTYSNLSYGRQQIWTDPLQPRRRAPDIIHSTPADWSAGPYTASPTTANGAVGKSQAYVDNWLLGLSGSYHRYAIGTFNTCSRGSTHRSLTDTGEGYNLGGVGLPHTTTWPSQPVVSTFHIRVPPGLQFNEVPLIKPKFLV